MILKNQVLRVEVNSLGAELKSIQYKNTEYLWQGDARYWERSSPILFPIVGRLLDNEYILNDKTYYLNQHGFARDKDFRMIEFNKHSITYMLVEDRETLSMYPYKFKLYVGYKLIDNRIEVSWKVVNTDNIIMHFQIGGHPAFNFIQGSILEINKKTNKFEMESTPYIQDVTPDLDISEIEIDNTTFGQGALIYDGLDEVVLKDDTKSVKINCEEFPFFGIWSKVYRGVNSPFICLEPWHGITDTAFHDKELINKKGIKVLEPQEEFTAKYIIEVN